MSLTWEQMHSIASDHADRVIFDIAKITSFESNSAPHSGWLHIYDEQMKEMNDELRSSTFKRTSDTLKEIGDFVSSIEGSVL
jgi:hypothetical protein